MRLTDARPMKETIAIHVKTTMKELLQEAASSETAKNGKMEYVQSARKGIVKKVKPVFRLLLNPFNVHLEKINEMIIRYICM